MQKTTKLTVRLQVLTKFKSDEDFSLEFVQPQTFTCSKMASKSSRIHFLRVKFIHDGLDVRVNRTLQFPISNMME